MTETETFEDINYLRKVAIRDKFVNYLKRGSLYQTHTFEVTPTSFKDIVPNTPLWLFAATARGRPRSKERPLEYARSQRPISVTPPKRLLTIKP